MSKQQRYLKLREHIHWVTKVRFVVSQWIIAPRTELLLYKQADATLDRKGRCYVRARFIVPRYWSSVFPEALKSYTDYLIKRMYEYQCWLFNDAIRVWTIWERVLGTAGQNLQVNSKSQRGYLTGTNSVPGRVHPVPRKKSRLGQHPRVLLWISVRQHWI